MAIAIITACAGLIGILLGGGVRAVEARWSRANEAKSVLTALCAEVEAINRWANHRQFLTNLQHLRAANAALAGQGSGDGPAHWLVLELTQNYFEVFEALAPKLGALDPYFADRITRFYTYAKGVSENYRPDAAIQDGLTAALAVEALDNDIMLLQTVHILGVHISGFRTIVPPKGIIDPFPMIFAAEEQATAASLSDATEPTQPRIEDAVAARGG